VVATTKDIYYISNNTLFNLTHGTDNTMIPINTYTVGKLINNNNNNFYVFTTNVNRLPNIINMNPNFKSNFSGTGSGSNNTKYDDIHEWITVNIKLSTTLDSTGYIISYGAYDNSGNIDTINTYSNIKVPYSIYNTFYIKITGLKSPNNGYSRFVCFSNFNYVYKSFLTTTITFYDTENNFSNINNNKDTSNYIINSSNPSENSGILLVYKLGDIFYQPPNNSIIQNQTLINIGNISYDSNNNIYTITLYTNNAFINTQSPTITPPSVNNSIEYNKVNK
jgi:hypothetical protein